MVIDNPSSVLLPRSASGAVSQASRAEQAARDFEAMFTSMMFKSMRKSVPEGSLIQRSMGEDIFTEMLDGEYAKMSAEKGSLGLAALILKEIQRNEGKNPPSTGDADVPLWALERRGPQSSSWHRGGNSATLVDRVRGKWAPLISEMSERFGVDEHLVTAVIARESAGNPRAISPKGAKGLMQLMDGTAREMGVNYSFSPAENIMGGVKYLRNMLKMFDGDEVLALASYNAGPGAVKRFGGIPPYKETQEYVKAVLDLRARAAAAAQTPVNKDADTEIAGNLNTNENSAAKSADKE